MSFFFTLFYLIAEYMRPQQMYEALSDLPLAEIVIIGIIISFVLEKRRLDNFNFQNILMLVFLFWFFISTLLAFKSEFAWQGLINFSKWAIIYFLLINSINERKKFYIFLILLLLLNFKYAQYAIRIWANRGFYSDPRGLYEGGGIGTSFFKNPNDFGIALNSIFGLSFYMLLTDTRKIFNWFKMRWFYVITTSSIPLAILATSSRGAALGLGGCFLGILYKSKKRVMAFLLVSIAAAIFLLLIPEDNWKRFQNMGTEEDKTGQERIKLLRAGIRMANEYPLTGVGPNNFVYVNKNIYHSDLHLVQHNIFIQAASELGYPGLFIFLMMIAGCFYNNIKTRRILKEKGADDLFLYRLSDGLDICLIGFIVNGFFITVLYYPFFWTLLVLNVALSDIVKQLAEGVSNIKNSSSYAIGQCNYTHL